MKSIGAVLILLTYLALPSTCTTDKSYRIISQYSSISRQQAKNFPGEGETSGSENHTERSRNISALAVAKTAATSGCCVAFLCSNNIKLYNAEMGDALWKIFGYFFECQDVAGMTMFMGQCGIKIENQQDEKCRLEFVKSGRVKNLDRAVSVRHLSNSVKM